MSEKTHQPTPKKLRDARQKGQLPRSRLLTSAAVTLGGLTGTLAFADDTWRRLTGWTSTLLSTVDAEPLTALHTALEVLARSAAPSLAGATTGALASSLALAGFQFNPSLVAPKLERLDLTQGFKKLFSPRQLVDVLKGLAVAAVVAWILWSAVASSAEQVLRGVHHDGASAFIAALSLLSPALVKASLVLLVLGLGDWALMRRRHVEDLKMSQQEVKQEHKNAEGDAHQKAKRKALHKQLAAGGAARGVRAATAVVVNPTHLAIALRYAEGECDAPYIVARGREEDALKLRREAEALQIPVVRDIPLARSLIHYDVGEEVPEELYQAAAAILKVALEVKGEEAPR